MAIPAFQNQLKQNFIHQLKRYPPLISELVFNTLLPLPLDICGIARQYRNRKWVPGERSRAKQRIQQLITVIINQNLHRKLMSYQFIINPKYQNDYAKLVQQFLNQLINALLEKYQDTLREKDFHQFFIDQWECQNLRTRPLDETIYQLSLTTRPLMIIVRIFNENLIKNLKNGW